MKEVNYLKTIQIKDNLALNKAEIITIGVKKSLKARNVSIKAKAANPANEVSFELIVPRNGSIKQAINFLNKNQAWVINKYHLIKHKIQHNKAIIPTKISDGGQIKILDTTYQISHSGKLRGVTAISGDEIIVYGPIELLPTKIMKLLCSLAEEELEKAVKHYCKILNLKFARITIKDTKSRWGSCAHNGNLAFSWRLIMAPKYVLEYVAAHEVAHLMEMNHSFKFWQIVKTIHPEYKNAETWLKKQGKLLQYIEF